MCQQLNELAKRQQQQQQQPLRDSGSHNDTSTSHDRYERQLSWLFLYLIDFLAQEHKILKTTLVPSFSYEGTSLSVAQHATIPEVNE